MSEYDTSLDPISPDFDMRTFLGGDVVCCGREVPLGSACPSCAPKQDFEDQDTPMLDEHGPMVVHPDLVREAIHRFTTVDGVPVSIGFAKRKARLLGREVSDVKALQVRLLASYPEVRQADFERA